MPKEKYDYLIVGGGISGAFASYAIRKNDKKGGIAIISSETHLPYDRVPLSKEFVRWERNFDELFFRKEGYYRKNGIDVLLGHTAVAIDKKKKTVMLDNGSKYHYNKLLIATGGKPRKLDIAGSGLEGVFYLRTIEDSIAIRQSFPSAKNAIVIGGGFIGCELAASMVSKGLDVTILEVMPHILGKAIDNKTSEWIKKYHESKGAKVLTGKKAVAIEGKDGHVSSVKTDDGKILAADIVAVGVGIKLNTDVAENAGIKVENGIHVNERMQVINEKDIFAAGDIANFYLPLLDRNMRVEHYDVAEKQGTVAGTNMAGGEASYNEPPYFFSDQYDLNINAFGDLSHPTKIVTKGEMSNSGFIQYYLEGKKLAAILAINYDWDKIEEEKEKIGKNQESLL
jgi:3-phenylpropionate/trans-cinnamate dioxygenase ferredoxin reductase subunit